MADLCFRTNAFPTAPEGDLEYCNGMPGSQLAEGLGDALLKMVLARIIRHGERGKRILGLGLWSQDSVFSAFTVSSVAKAQF